MLPTAKILVIDDDAGIRFYLKAALSREGYQVVTVASGETALERAATEEFDLALIDLMMKGMGGMQVLAALRQQSPDTTVIVLTAHASLETAVEALRQGAHDYLFKPCTTVALRESVRTGLLKRQGDLRQHELLTQLRHSLTSSLEDLHATIAEQPITQRPTTIAPAEEQARFLQRGGLVVDFMRHVITLDGHLLELSPTEFDLLAHLITETPRVVSPQELVREVQGYESEQWEASEIVRQHIYRIRQKIEKATGRTNVIRTVRGVGYTIDE